MKLRNFGTVPVSEVGLGCWQIGGDQWGAVSDVDALGTLRAAVESGTTFLDTADIYGSGRSEELIGRFRRERPGQLFIATKLGRSSNPGWPENFTEKTIRQHTEGSLKRLGVECLDLTQLHCVPLEELERGDVFESLRKLQTEGKIRRFGASVESTAEALSCLKQSGLASLQIIFNIYRQTPSTAFFEECLAKNVAVIVRLPLASGMLAGKYTKATQFDPKDHRSYNRNGEKFNVGETFAGLPFEKGLELTEKLKTLLPPGYTLPTAALRWCLDFPAVKVIIPGARNAEQAKSNASASSVPPLPADVHEKIRRFYRDEVKSNVRGPD